MASPGLAGAGLAGRAARLAGCCSGVLTDISIGIENVSLVGFSAVAGVLALPGSTWLAWLNSALGAVGAAAAGRAMAVATGAGAGMAAVGAGLAAGTGLALAAAIGAATGVATAAGAAA